MKRRLHLSLNSFICLTALAALAALVLDFFASQGQPILGQWPAAFALFAACCLVTELRPLRWLRLDEGSEVTASWTFMMALLLVGPPLAAVGVSAALFVAGDIWSRKAPLKVVFNVAQIVVSMSLGVAVLQASGQGRSLLGHGAPSLVWFPALAAASVLVFAVNNTLTSIVIALHQGIPIVPLLRSAIAVNLSTDGVLLSLSPIFVVAAERSLLLVPILLVTTWTVYRSTKLALFSRHDATHDSLTQLANRRLFDDHLHSAVVAAQRTGERVGVVLIDLDGFKQINDDLGHDVGDQVLQQVAVRMNGARRPADLLARLGGDEFAVILTHLDSLADAADIAQSLLAPFSQACIIEGVPVLVAASLGVAVLPDHAEDAATLLRRADEAMYAAKVGQRGVIMYRPHVNDAGVGRLGLLANLADALLANEFFLDYQPQISLITNRICGVEALIRWRHPTAGVLYPATFMPLAEQTELIGPITEWVLREALAQCARWQRDGLFLRMAVNISARNMNDVRFPELVSSVIRDIGVSPKYLDLEITENTVGLDHSAVHSVLLRLRAIGVSLSIDDFGTGYSSMTQLRDMAVDQIKIDRSFVTNMTGDDKDVVIVRAIVQLGQALGIETIAEGVEDAAVADLLRGLGCTSAQGFLFGRPMAPAELVRRLASHDPWMTSSLLLHQPRVPL